MDERGCGLALSFLIIFMMLKVMFVGTSGLLAMFPFLLLMLFFAAAVRISVGSGVIPLDGIEEPATTLRHEQSILRAAAKHQGRITPVLAAMEGEQLSVADAQVLLDHLTEQGFCVVETDANGRPVYDFGLNPQTRRELSPDEWVEQMDEQPARRQRMTSPADATTEQRSTRRLDA